MQRNTKATVNVFLNFKPMIQSRSYCDDHFTKVVFIKRSYSKQFIQNIIDTVTDVKI